VAEKVVLDESARNQPDTDPLWDTLIVAGEL
jgi:hypothetical protein